MLAHNDIAFVIDQAGHLRQELNFDPGPGTAATKSSFAAELADAAPGCWAPHEQRPPVRRRAGPGRRRAGRRVRQRHPAPAR